LTGFLQETQPENKVKDYKFKSQGVIDLLKKLKQKFEEDKDEATRSETATLNEFNVMKDARKAAVKAAKDAKEEKTGLKGEAEEALAGYEKDLKDKQDDFKADDESLKTTIADCDLKADEWKTRSATRENEVKAIQQAIEIMAKVAGVRAPEFMQGASFIQIDDPKAKASKILVEEAQKMKKGGKALRKLAQAIRSGSPFDSINIMMQKMIFQLMAEQKDEDDHNNWCVAELEKSEEGEEYNKNKKEELEDKMEEAEAKTVELANDLDDLQKEISELATSIKEETEIRTEEKAENTAAIKDAQDAQKAVSKAIEVLTAFYKESGKVPKEPWEFIQTEGGKPAAVDAPPDTWGSSYSGLSGEPDGILGMLEKVGEDFSTMESETQAEEDSNQKAFDEEMTENMIDKATKEKSHEMKTQERARLVEKLKAWKKHLFSVESELEAVQSYLKTLHEACTSGDSTYEDRKEARDGEIEALKTAKKVLEEAFKDKGDFLQKKANIHHH